MNPHDNPDRACRDADTDLFFPHPNDISGGRMVARTYCGECPVKLECLEFALRVEGGSGHSGRSGIYGGTSARQRYALSAKRRKEAS